MNRVLIDTNIILDFLQDRQPFIEDAVKLFEKVDSGEVEGFIAATTITNIYGVTELIYDSAPRLLVWGSKIT